MVLTHLENAKAHASKSAESIKKTVSNLTNRIYSENEVEPEIVNALKENLIAFQSLTDALNNLPEEIEEPSLFDKLNEACEVKTQVYMDEDWLFHCQIFSPPILKSAAPLHKRLSQNYVDFLMSFLEPQVIKVMPENFKPFNSAYVIYINHFEKRTTPRASYFDNDNLAIKGLLDSIVPHICVDDAAVFCDNLYFAQEDSSTYIDLFIVKKPMLFEWAKRYPNLDFSKTILGL